MANWGAFAGGLLEGVGNGLTDNAKAMRDEAQTPPAPDAATANIQLQSRLADQNAAAASTRQLGNETTMAGINNANAVGMVGVQGAQTQANAKVENGLLVGRQQAGFAHDDVTAIRAQAFQAAESNKTRAAAVTAAAVKDQRDGEGIKEVVQSGDGTFNIIGNDKSITKTNVVGAPKVGADGLSPGDMRLITAMKAAHMVASDNALVPTLDAAGMAADLARRGRPDLAADYSSDPAYAAGAAAYAAKRNGGNAAPPMTAVASPWAASADPLGFTSPGDASASSSPVTNWGGGATPHASTLAAPVTGARQAPDGNWYVPNPAKPGGYMRVGI
jgi:hypothetical protein